MARECGGGGGVGPRGKHQAPVSPPWWPPRRGREEWEIVAPCSVPPPDLPLPWNTTCSPTCSENENYQRLLTLVPPPAWPSEEGRSNEGERNPEEAARASTKEVNENKNHGGPGSGGGLVLSGAFMKQLALNEKRRKERKRREAKPKPPDEASTDMQFVLERRRDFERSEALADVLKRRQELRAFREDIYGPGQLDSIMDMEDEVNENFDKLCASMQAPAWPTPRI